MDPLGFSILGSGEAARIHASSLKRLSRVARPVVVYSRSLERAREFAREHGIPKATNDLEEAVASSDVDAVVVALPNELHARASLEAIRRGKHVFVEKPMALSLKDAVEMIRESERAGVRLVVGNCLRYWPEYARVRGLIAGGSLGEPRVARAYRLSGFPGGWRASRSSGGVVMDSMILDLDYLVWILGDVEKVYALGAELGGMAQGVYGHVMAILSFKEGAIAYTEASWSMPKGYQGYYLEVAGTEGLAVVDSRAGKTLEVYTSGSIMAEAPQDEDAYLAEMKAFIEWIMGRGEPPTTGYEAIKSLAAALAILRSTELGRPVGLAEVGWSG